MQTEVGLCGFSGSTEAHTGQTLGSAGADSFTRWSSRTRGRSPRGQTAKSIARRMTGFYSRTEEQSRLRR